MRFPVDKNRKIFPLLPFLSFFSTCYCYHSMKRKRKSPLTLRKRGSLLKKKKKRENTDDDFQPQIKLCKKTSQENLSFKKYEEYEETERTIAQEEQSTEQGNHLYYFFFDNNTHRFIG
ncbi:uncharacterized protein BX663DRAFT_138638 [Cokeromyces recurvatus]|uniref:uncharacterized protein n=1 Tax=Cokeromyces recurvatus TaxID=90255 RepID=UPI00221EFB27|nr:uncharacterized protein BX663DRAFT_138638 [Cokeromyces recurvatus]KAI7900891.1 hypothetical protein BX663DRAFT_138638 [Cokeromyces recurvatus]